VKAIVRDVQTWSVFSDQNGYAFNGYAVGTEEGTVLPLPSGGRDKPRESVERSAHR
jgi:hypothetical protein